MTIIQELVYKVKVESGLRKGVEDVKRESEDLKSSIEGMSKGASDSASKTSKAFGASTDKVKKDAKTLKGVLKGLSNDFIGMGKSSASSIAGVGGVLTKILGGFGAIGTIATTAIGASVALNRLYYRGVEGNAERIGLGQLSSRTGIDTRTLDALRSTATGARYNVSEGEYNSYLLKSSELARQRLRPTRAPNGFEMSLIKYGAMAGIDTSNLKTTSAVDQVIRRILRNPAVAASFVDETGISPALQDFLTDPNARGNITTARALSYETPEYNERAKRQGEFERQKAQRAQISERYKTDNELDAEETKKTNRFLGAIQGFDWVNRFLAYGKSTPQERVFDLMNEVESGQTQSRIPIEEIRRRYAEIQQTPDQNERIRLSWLLQRDILPESKNSFQNLTNLQSGMFGAAQSNTSGDIININNVNVNSNPQNVELLTRDVKNQAKNSKEAVAFSSGVR